MTRAERSGERVLKCCRRLAAQKINSLAGRHRRRQVLDHYRAFGVRLALKFRNVPTSCERLTQIADFSTQVIALSLDRIGRMARLHTRLFEGAPERGDFRLDRL